MPANKKVGSMEAEAEAKGGPALTKPKMADFSLWLRQTFPEQVAAAEKAGPAALKAEIERTEKARTAKKMSGIGRITGAERRALRELQEAQRKPGGTTTAGSNLPAGTSAPGDTKTNEQAVKEFHRSSRLHFLGTWRERFEKWRRTLSSSDGALHPDASFQPTPTCPTAEVSHLFAYCDMDAFFASVAMKDFSPADKDFPTAVVSGLHGYSEVCSANYAARREGVKPKFVRDAQAVCPRIRLIPVTPELLQDVENVWKCVFLLLVKSCSPLVDMRSCDEAVCRVPYAFRDRPQIWGDAVRELVWKTTGVTLSVGVGHSVIVARMCSKFAKPNGTRCELTGQSKEFMRGVPLEDLPGVGRKILEKLSGLKTCGDLQKRGRKNGENIYALACGKDVGTITAISLDNAVGRAAAIQSLGLHDPQGGSRGVLGERELRLTTKRKTMSSEMNWGVRPSGREDAVRLLTAVLNELYSRVPIRTVMKLLVAGPDWVEPPKPGGHGPCEQVTKSVAVNRNADMIRCGLGLFDDLKVKDCTRIRGLGATASLESEKAKGPGARSGATGGAGPRGGSAATLIQPKIIDLFGTAAAGGTTSP
eukprot:g5719.t1